MGFALIGAAILAASHAVTPTANFEAENGTLGTTAEVVNDSAASGTKAVAFGSGDIVLAAAGDIQKPRADLHYGTDTANLIKNQIKPSMVIVPGDIQYETGTLADFNNYFNKTWGGTNLGSRVYPSPGNHDYQTAGATGYFSYFQAGTNTINGNAVTGPANSGWYAFDAGSNWRIYSLNSETAGTTAATQNTWLASDMAAHPKACTLFFAHKPYYDYGTVHAGEGDASLPWYKTFYDKGGDVVITGHEHNYQRFKPVNPYTDAVDTARGLQTFVVGTGGADNLYPGFGSTMHSANNLIVTNNGVNAWGVLKLTLHPNSYNWEFVPINANAYTDSGSGQCHS